MNYNVAQRTFPIFLATFNLIRHRCIAVIAVTCISLTET